MPRDKIDVPDEREGTTTVVSGNRPLTRAARRDLKEFDIRSVDHPKELGRMSVVEVESRPERSVLDRHELHIEEEPVAIIEATGGDEVKIFPDRVISNGAEATLGPEEAVEEAQKRGWDINWNVQPPA